MEKLWLPRILSHGFEGDGTSAGGGADAPHALVPSGGVCLALPKGGKERGGDIVSAVTAMRVAAGDQKERWSMGHHDVAYVLRRSLTTFFLDRDGEARERGAETQDPGGVVLTPTALLRGEGSWGRFP